MHSLMTLLDGCKDAEDVTIWYWMPLTPIGRFRLIRESVDSIVVAWKSMESPLGAPRGPPGARSRGTGAAAAPAALGHRLKQDGPALFVGAGDTWRLDSQKIGTSHYGPTAKSSCFLSKRD